MGAVRPAQDYGAPSTLAHCRDRVFAGQKGSGQNHIELVLPRLDCLAFGGPSLEDASVTKGDIEATKHGDRGLNRALAVSGIADIAWHRNGASPVFHK
jgi:hypothetical protein